MALNRYGYTEAEPQALTKEALDAGAHFHYVGPLGIELDYGRLISYKPDERKETLLWPVFQYANLGYVDPSRIGELENFDNYGLEGTKHIHVRVRKGDKILYNVNFVRDDPTSDSDNFPTEELFDLSSCAKGRTTAFINSYRHLIVEPSRLTSADRGNYIRQNRETGSLELKLAKSMLAIGIALATESLGVRTWIMNYAEEQAGAFVWGLTGMKLNCLPGAQLRPEAYDGPFGPYFRKHDAMASPICVALVDARRLAFRMGRQGRADIESTLTRENKKTTAELKRVN